MSPRTSKIARYSSSAPCMRMTQSSRSPASSDRRTSPICTAREPSSSRGCTPNTRSTARTKSAARSTILLMPALDPTRSGSAAPTDARAKPVRPEGDIASGAASSETLRHRVEGERSLERMRDAVERVLRELRADQLQTHKQSLREPARNQEPRQADHVQRDRQDVS